MITASFIKQNGAYTAFRVCGHSGYAEAGSDIICAAVSAMVMLTVNTVQDGFGEDVRLETNEREALISCTLKRRSEAGSIIITCLKAELEALAEQYPQNILVKE